MACQGVLKQPPVFSLLAATVLQEVENPSAHLEKKKSDLSGQEINPSGSGAAPPPLPACSPLPGLCGAVSLPAFLSERRLCSGWQSWVSEIEDLVRQSQGEGWWLSLHSLSMDGSQSWDEGGHKMDDRVREGCSGSSNCPLLSENLSKQRPVSKIQHQHPHKTLLQDDLGCVPAATPLNKGVPLGVMKLRMDMTSYRVDKHTWVINFTKWLCIKSQGSGEHVFSSRLLAQSLERQHIIYSICAPV